MGVAALVLGIISIIIAFVPFCGSIAFFPALVGLILGIIDIVQKSKKGEQKGMAIAGTILTSIAIVIIALWIFVFGTIIGSAMDYVNEHQDEIVDFLNEEQEFLMDEYYTNLYNDEVL